MAWLWDLLTGWIPVRMWQVEHAVAGGGPWFDDVYDASAFVTSESAEMALMGEGHMLIFPMDDLRALESGRIGLVQRGDWTISRVKVPRRELKREWDGW